jgi:hypothetical protein
MTTQITPARTADVLAEATPAPVPRKPRPVLWWASLGVAALGLQAWIYGSWLVSGDVHSLSVGRAQVPHSDRVWAWIWQPVFLAGALAAVVYVARGVRRQRRVTLEAKILLAWWAVMWMDPAANLLRPQYFFNSYYVNIGSWAPHIPGWISRRGGDLAFAPMINGSSYTASVLAAVGGAKLMAYVRARRPRIGPVGLVVIAWAALSVVVFVTEDVLIRSGWLAWNGIPAVTLWAHTRLAIPLTEVLGWGIPQTALAALLFFRGDRGEVAVDRGIDRVRVSGRRRTLLSTLAVIGFATVAQGVYAVISAPVGLYVGTQPSLPSYMRNGVCGQGTPYRCPGPAVPALLPRTPLRASAAQ